MQLMHLLGGIAILAFLVIVLLSKTPRKTFIIATICSFPLLDIPVTPFNLGGLRVFDVYSYIIFLLLFRDFIAVDKNGTRYGYFFGMLFLVLLLGSLTSQFITTSLISLQSIIPVFIFGKALIDECQANEKFRDEIIKLFKIVTAVAILFMIPQIFLGLKFTFYPNLNPNTDGPDGIRYPSFFHDPQKYAQFLTMMSFVLLISAERTINVKSVALFIISIFAILLTGGRSAIIGLAGGLAVLMLFLEGRLKIAILSILILGCLPLIFFSDSLITFDRLGDFQNDYDFRSSIWKEAFQIFLNHPMFGIGIGNYQSHVQYYATDQYFVYDNVAEYFDQPESGFLKILVEFGLVGFLIFALFVVLPIINFVRLPIAKSADLRNPVLISSIVSWGIAFNSVYSLSDRRIALTLVCMLSLLIVEAERN